MSVRHALGMTVHLLPEAHCLFADTCPSVVHLIAAGWWHTSSCFRGTYHILIELDI